MKTTPCPVCDAATTRPYHTVESYQFYECEACDSLFIDPAVIAEMDAGRPIRSYDQAYWKTESAEARARSFGPALSRVAETLLYARLPVRRFLDIGTGPGFLLDALSTYLPASRDLFWGIEQFPPRAAHHARQLCDRRVGRPAGHLPGRRLHRGDRAPHPPLLRNLIAALAAKSDPNSLYLFNTGLSSFVKNGHGDYLDPLGRGHIVSWELAGLARLFGEHGFRLTPFRQVVGLPRRISADAERYPVRPAHLVSGRRQQGDPA